MMTDEYAKALKQYENREFDAADATLSKGLEADPDHVPALRLRAAVALERNAPAEGIPFMERALELLGENNPSRGDYLTNYGVLLFRAEKLPEAEQALREAVALLPDEPRAIGTLVVCLRQQDRAQEAYDLARDFVSKSPQDAERWLLLANCEVALGDYSVYARGIASLQNGALSDAVRYLSHTASVEPDNVRYAFDSCVAATQFGRWNGKEAELPELLDNLRKSATPATQGIYNLFASAALFRASRLDKANEQLGEAKKAMAAVGNWSDVRFADEAAKTRLERYLADSGSDAGTPGAVPEDVTLTEAYWVLRNVGQRRFAFESAEAIQARVLRALLKGLLEEKSDIGTVTQIGVLCGDILHTLANEFPRIKFRGIVESHTIAELNKRDFSADNLEFRCDDALSALRDADAVQDGLLLHINALHEAMPGLVRALYETAREKGYRHIAALEPVGYDREALRYPAFGHGFPSFVRQGRALVHDYPALLSQTWFDVEYTDRYSMVSGLGSLANADLHLFYALGTFKGRLPAA